MNVIIDWRKWLAKRRELLREVVINCSLHKVFGRISLKKDLPQAAVNLKGTKSWTVIILDRNPQKGAIPARYLVAHILYKTTNVTTKNGGTSHERYSVEKNRWAIQSHVLSHT
jgi:hypothetical protein